MNFPVFDLHCDTAYAMLGTGYDSHCSLRRNALHIDLERAGTLAGYAQCFACFTSDPETLPLDISPEDLFERELAGIQEGLRQNSDLISQCFSPAQIEENRNSGKMSAVLSIEGPAGFGYDPGRLEALYGFGFRITTLGWNEANPLSGSHKTGGGLTHRGQEYVRQAQKLGMLVDVSHISDRAFWDIMDITQGPVIASHSNSRTVHNVSRNLTDEMFSAICRSGGVAGINLYADFVGDEAGLDRLCDHILHFLELDPTGKHIALGGDLDGCDQLVRGFTGVQDYPKLAQVLLNRGLKEREILDIFWNNAMGVMKECCI